MMASEIEVGAMHRAVVLSTFGLGGTSPNPPVGCVVLDHGGRVIGEGYHQRRGEPHTTVTEDLDHLLKTPHAGGTRSVPAACRPDLSHRLLAARLVDQAVCYAVPADPSGVGEPVPASWPDGFDVEAVDPTEGWVRITATPSRPDTGAGQ